jgi:hypothetical protein
MSGGQQRATRTAPFAPAGALLGDLEHPLPRRDRPDRAPKALVAENRAAMSRPASISLRSSERSRTICA